MPTGAASRRAEGPRAGRRLPGERLGARPQTPLLDQAFDATEDLGATEGLLHEVVGTDAWSWDAPFSHTARRWAETGDPSIIWEGHKAGRIRPYYQIEKLTNLASLPSHGFTLSCFPVKIERASAGWIRAVALLDG